MPSPFPGMDPHLEADGLWPDFHRQFVQSLQSTLGPILGDRYRARQGQRVYFTEQTLFTSIQREERSEDYLEVRHRGDGKLVTLLEVVSPANKLTPQGRSAYLARRKECRQAGASIVEIDLVNQGQPTLDYSREGLPEWDHAVTVTRATQPERFEIYTTTYRKRLPRFRLPLTPDDTDAVVDLQAIFSRCYDQGGFASRIDYTRDPVVGLDDDDLAWLAGVLRQHKLR